jgi:glycosyltransferase involved in cell wall biosynthesis
MKDTPLVSICCITYNHESFIRDAIEGFLMQKTEFLIEIVIHDDASTDNTAEIIKEYAEKYPSLFVPIYQYRNQFSQGIKPLPNFVFPAARGKYIALCDGDDYWTDPFKLQKQVDFLESNPEVGLVFTKAKEMKKDSVVTKLTGGKVETFNDLLVANPIPTLTTCLRNSILQEYLLTIKPGNKSWLMGDLPIWLWFSFTSKIEFIDETTANYRVLSESASHFNSFEKSAAFANGAFEIRKFFLMKFNKGHQIRAVEKANFQRLFLMSLQYRKYRKSLGLFFESTGSNMKTLVKYCLGHYS